MNTPLELVGVDIFGQVRVNAQRRGESDQETRKEADEFVRSLRQGLEVRGSSSEQLEGNWTKNRMKTAQGRLHGTEGSANQPRDRDKERNGTEGDDAVSAARQRPKTADAARCTKASSECERRPFTSRGNAANAQNGTGRSATKTESGEHCADHGSTANASRKPNLTQLRSAQRGIALGAGMVGVSRPSGVSRRYEPLQSRTIHSSVESSKERSMATRDHVVSSTTVEAKNAALHHPKRGELTCKGQDLAPSKTSQSAETDDQCLLQEEEELRQLEAKLERDRSALAEKKMRVRLERMAEELRLEGERALLEFEDALQSEVEENIFAMMKDKEGKVAECRRLQAELQQHISHLEAVHADLGSRADEYEQSYAAAVQRVKELHAGAIAAKRQAIEDGVVEKLEAETRKKMEPA